MMHVSKFLGVGSFVPPNIYTNNDLAKFMETSDEWIQQRTGIKQRHWVDQDSNTSSSDLGVEAAKAALNHAGVSKDDIDMIFFATLSPDHEFPGTACFFQAKMEMPGIPAIDIRQQCSGFLYAITIADQFIKTGAAKMVLVVGAEVHSKGLDKTTRGRDVSVIFGDGAGAAVLGRCEKTPSKNDSQILTTKIHADGRFAKELWIASPGLALGPERINQSMLDEGLHYPQMNGKTVFIHAAKKMPEAVLESLEGTGYTLGDIDLFIFHQANLRINEMVAKQLGIPEARVFNTIDRFGNTTAATIPIGMSEAIKAGKLKPGMLVATAAFGSGFTWSSALFRF